MQESATGMHERSLKSAALVHRTFQSMNCKVKEKCGGISGCDLFVCDMISACY